MFSKDDVPFEVNSEQPWAVGPPVIGLGILAVVFAVVAVIISHGILAPATVTVEHAAQTDEAAVDDQSTNSVYVHVLGCVANPGLYELQADARVADAIESAGGFTDQAAQESVNLAAHVSDGEQIRISSREEALQAGSSVSSAAGDAAAALSSGKVNINTASAEELQTLSGIGQSTAAKIVGYRQKNGSFASIDDLKNVSGIGDKRLESLRPYITL